MSQQEMEELIRIYQNGQAGIEKKTTIERINGQVSLEDPNLIQIDNDCYLDNDDSIREINTFSIKIFACGCKANGRENWGGVDYKRNIVCVKHFYRCIRCRRPLSTLTVKPINGYCYCARCARIVKFLRFLGLKK